MKSLFIFIATFCLGLNHEKDCSQSSPIIITPNYNKISSISKLLEPYTGKPVFIYLWTTWCEPCIDEFKYSRTLYDFLKSNGIEMLYVSVDDHDSIWKAKIEEFNLAGNHVRANKILRDSLSTLLWGAPGGYSIPIYLIFDRNGKLLKKNLFEPSSGNKLCKEIIELLN